MTQPDDHFSVAVRHTFRCATSDAYERLVDDLSTAWFADGTATTVAFDPRRTSFTFLCDVPARDHRDAVQRALSAVDTATRGVPERPGVEQQDSWQITVTRLRDEVGPVQERPQT